MKTLNSRLWADQPSSSAEPVPAPVPAQSEREPRAVQRAKRATSRTAKKEARTAERAKEKEARTAERAKEKEARTTRRTAERAKKTAKPSRTTELRNKLESKLREKAAEPVALTPDARAGLMGVSRRSALVVITILDLLATAVSFGESWDALYQWATHHGLKGAWAVAFPLQIDTFIAMGELALFVAILDHWSPRHRVWAWVSTFGGLAVSMVGNVGHVTGHPGSWQATAAVPPLAAMAGMFIGFQVLKRVMNPTKKAVQDQETQELIIQLRRQVDDLSRAALVVGLPQPEPVNVPEPRPAEPGQFFTGDRPEPATAFWMGQAANQVVGPDGTHPTQVIPEPQDDVTREGAPLSTLYPKSPADMVVKPVRRPEPKPQPTPRRKRGGRHPKWDDGVKLYRESGATKDERLSQRELAAALDMKNRSLAARIIDHVENGGE